MKHGSKYLGRIVMHGDWTEEGIITVGYIPMVIEPFFCFRSSTVEGVKVILYKENIQIIKEL